MKNSELRRFIALILIIADFHLHAFAGWESDEADEEEQDSREFETTFVRNIQDDFQNGFVELLNFVNSTNNSLTTLNSKLAFQSLKIASHDSLIAAQNVHLDAKIDDLKNEIQTIKDLIIGSINRTCMVQRSETESHLTSELNAFRDDLISCRKSTVITGKSFNGSTLSDIKTRAFKAGRKGYHTVIIFVNYLDEAVEDFKMYERHNNSLYTPAPNLIPAHTKEVFTFAAALDHIWTAFSYKIPAANIRIAAISMEGAWGVGLAFVPIGLNMKDYFEFKLGIPGSSVWEIDLGAHMDKNQTVGYRNLRARISADYEAYHQATLRIELVQLPSDD